MVHSDAFLEYPTVILRIMRVAQLFNMVLEQVCTAAFWMTTFCYISTMVTRGYILLRYPRTAKHQCHLTSHPLTAIQYYSLLSVCPIQVACYQDAGFVEGSGPQSKAESHMM